MTGIPLRVAVERITTCMAAALGEDPTWLPTESWLAEVLSNLSDALTAGANYTLPSVAGSAGAQCA